jgi:hypothetical protein
MGCVRLLPSARLLSARPLSARLLSARLLAATLLTAASGLAGAAQPLNEHELSQVYAAGLPNVGRPLGDLTGAGATALDALHEQGAALDRQQALAQYQLAAATLQTGVGLAQSVALVGLLTPTGPMMLPVIAMPFPFFMMLPQEKKE